MKKLSFFLLLVVWLGIASVSHAAVNVEGESFSVSSGKRVENTNDSTASGGVFKQFFTVGTVSKSVTTNTVSGVTVRLRASQPLCGPDWPKAVIGIDGTTIATVIVDSVVWKDYSFVRNLTSGSHTYTVNFPNDYFEPRDAFSVSPPKPLTCDRNLHFDLLAIAEGTPPPPPSPACSDAADNDGDGKIDYPADPGCSSATDTDETDPAPPPPPTGSGVKWTSGFEYSTFTLGRTSEWSAASAQNSTRYGTTTSPAFKGSRSGFCRVQDGDNSYGERCEITQGNTSSSNLNTARLYNAGEELWIMHAFLIPDQFAFCGTSCPFDYDGGLITQEKQLGSCGTPVLGIVSRNMPTIGITIEQRNSAETDCGNATMKSLWRVSGLQRNRWIKVARKIKFSIDPKVGFVETYIDTDGNSTNDFSPVPQSLDGNSKFVTRVANPFGGTDGYRIFTWTQKEGSSVDHPSQCLSARCSHQRWGVYRNPGVTGTSTMYTDSWAIGTSFPDVYAAAF